MPVDIPTRPGSPRSRMRPAVALKRGFRRRCPRCGDGPLFQQWIKTYERCPVCNLLYQRDHGDIWIFIILMDRLPIGLGVILVYLGFRSASTLGAIALFVALGVPLIATIRERQGVALALDYLSRVYFPDPSDEIHQGGDYVRP